MIEKQDIQPRTTSEPYSSRTIRSRPTGMGTPHLNNISVSRTRKYPTAHNKPTFHLIGYDKYLLAFAPALRVPAALYYMLSAVPEAALLDCA